MKKFLVFIICFVSILSCTGCKQEETNLSTICGNLTTYTLNINLDVENKCGKVNQIVNYINNSNSILKQLKFHLYPQFFKEGATDFVVNSTKLNQAYPNGMSFAEFEIERVQIDGVDTTPTYEGDNNNILCISLPHSLLPEHKITLNIDFSFTLPNCEHRFGYGDNTINLANFYPIACIYENGTFSTNPYNANGDPFYSEVANYNVKISLDKNYIVASSGEKLNESIENNKKTINYSAIVVRDFALVVSNKFQVASNTINNTLV